MSKIFVIKYIPEGNFPIHLKLIKKHQRKYPSLLGKYKDGTYHTGCFFGESNIDLNLIMCEDDICIP